uniref:Uncharacterized protein n=1 Tax=uncultured marine virus TaxID=186617 RepID=A0A0F7L3H0_9VIRU|nr:hypothetical protein [uncultured marine virus]
MRCRYSCRLWTTTSRRGLQIAPTVPVVASVPSMPSRKNSGRRVNWSVQLPSVWRMILRGLPSARKNVPPAKSL